MSVDAMGFSGMENTSASWWSTLSMMTGMFGIGHYNKIINAVIMPNAIDMMNNFTFANRSTDMTRHDKRMFSNISVSHCIRVIRHFYIDISSGSLPSTTFPLEMFRTFLEWHSITVLQYEWDSVNG